MFNHAAFRKINTFIFDVDGVFTDSTIFVSEDGSLQRTMNVRDGQAIKLAKKAGYYLAVITKGQSSGVEIRLKNLGITHFYGACEDKLEAFHDLCDKLEVDRDQMLYIGDDIPDIVLFDKVGISCSPADGSNIALQQADYVCIKGGGKGCVREVIEKVMRIQDKWPL
jgi:3-deoxy-D-manno-octulosonate 8-phosphate phosphatase (KDO 8-P phosphatase)